MAGGGGDEKVGVSGPVAAVNIELTNKHQYDF